MEHGSAYDRIVIGPYLFGLSYFASQAHPDRTYLVPCLHDEPSPVSGPFAKCSAR